MFQRRLKKGSKLIMAHSTGTQSNNVPVKEMPVLDITVLFCSIALHYVNSDAIKISVCIQPVAIYLLVSYSVRGFNETCLKLTIIIVDDDTYAGNIVAKNLNTSQENKDSSSTNLFQTQ